MLLLHILKENRNNSIELANFFNAYYHTKYQDLVLNNTSHFLNSPSITDGRELKGTTVRYPPVSDCNIKFYLLVRRDGVLSTQTYEHYATVNNINNLCKIRKVSYNGGRKHRKLRNTINFRKAYGSVGPIM